MQAAATTGGPTAVSVKALQKELRHILDEGVEGFTVKLVDENNLFEWEVVIFGPPQTLYEGGYFKLLMKFPADYPYSPPSVRFLTKVWHPNVYENGDLCISILHPPVDDPQSGELPSERWNPTQNVRTVLLSVISLLNEPNTFSPANVDASVMYRKWKESKGENKEYEDYVRKLVADTQVEAARENVKVPTTVEEYVATRKTATGSGNSAANGGGSGGQDGPPDVTDFYDDDYDDYDDDDDDDEDDDDEVDDGDEGDQRNSEDSGNGET